MSCVNTYMFISLVHCLQKIAADTFVRTTVRDDDIEHSCNPPV